MTDDIKRPRHEHPRQPIVRATDGVIRFQRNQIVCWLLERATRGLETNMNTIASADFDARDREQFAQLIGYSVSGFGGLSYVRRETARQADAEATRVAALSYPLPTPAPTADPPQAPPTSPIARATIAEREVMRFVRHLEQRLGERAERYANLMKVAVDEAMWRSANVIHTTLALVRDELEAARRAFEQQAPKPT